VIAFISDFINADYVLLYKVNHTTGLVTNHKKVIYGTTTIAWERNYIASQLDITCLSLGLPARKTLIVLNNTDLSLYKAFDIKSTIPTWHAKIGMRVDNQYFFAWASPTVSPNTIMVAVFAHPNYPSDVY